MQKQQDEAAVLFTKLNDLKKTISLTANLLGKKGFCNLITLL